MGLTFIAGLAAGLTPASTSFNVTASVERIRYTTGPAADNILDLNDARYFAISRSGEQKGTFTGELQIAPGADVTVTRISNGSLTVAVQTDGRTVGRFNGSPMPKISGYVDFTVSDILARTYEGSTVLIPLSGEVEEVGRNVGSLRGSTSILRSGTIRMLGRTFTGTFRDSPDDVYEAGTKALYPGDQFRVVEAESESHGFIVANEQPGLTVTYRTQGRKGQIFRPGPVSSDYTFSAPLLGRITNDTSFQVVSSLLGALISLSAVVAAAFTYLNYIRNNNPTVQERHESTHSQEMRIPKKNRVYSPFASFDSTLCSNYSSVTVVYAGTHSSSSTVRPRRVS